MPRVIVNSIPKSGTHLLERALYLLGVSDGQPLFLSGATAGEYAPDDGEQLPVGVGMPVMVSARKLRERLDNLPAGKVITAHVAYSRGMENLLGELGYRMLLMVRDPRDVAVSLAHHIAREQGHRLHQQFLGLSPDQRISRTIAGCPQLQDVRERFSAVLPWADSETCLTVRFEDLVGAKGGGSDEAQRRAIEAVCRHLGLADGDVEAVQRELFGQGATFRRGTIGQWREQFTPEHQRLFEQVAGDLLERLGYS